MKAFLMHPDRDFDLKRGPAAERDRTWPTTWSSDVLLRAMAGGDKFLLGVARRGLHSGLASPAEIVYRQHVLADCIGPARRGPGALRGRGRRRSPGKGGSSAGRSEIPRNLILYRVPAGDAAVPGHAAAAAGHRRRPGRRLRSEGFTRFFAMLASELDDEYLAEIEAHLDELAFRRGTLISARLGRAARAWDTSCAGIREQGWRDRMAPGPVRLHLLRRRTGTRTECGPCRT